MEFSFRIRNTLRESVALFKKHLWFFVGVAAVTVVLNLVGNGKHTPWPVALILTIATFVWSIVMMKFSLAAADNKEELLSFSQVRAMLPSWKQALGVIGVGLLGGLITIAGFILLIIPGIWIAFRLSLASLVYIDRGEGIRKSLRTSFNMTKGSIFWTTVLACLVAGGLYLVGFILLVIGLLFAYPIAMIFMAKFYRALTVHHGHTAPTTPHADPIVVQAQEIEAPKPEAHHEIEMKM